MHRRDVDPNWELTDRQAVLEALRRAGPRGVHSLDLRRGSFSANPAERIRELAAADFEISHQVERRGKRNGTRYTLLYEPAEVDVTARHGGAGGVDLGGPADDTQKGSPGETQADRVDRSSGRVGAAGSAQTRAPASSDETNDGRFPSGGEGSGSLFDGEEFERRPKHDELLEDAA